MTGERAASLRRGLIVSALTLAVLAGCSRSQPAPEEDNFANQVTETPPAATEPAPVEEQAPPPRLPEPDRNVAEALPPEEAPSPDAQMLEDADATGLTARTAPAESVSEPSTETGTAPSSETSGN